MKILAAIVFLSSFIMLTFSRPFTLLSFYLNQDVIIAKYCVNKNKPKMHCNGKCFLANKIKEQEKREAGTAIMELSKIEVFSSKSFYTNYIQPKFDVLKIDAAVYVTSNLSKPFTNGIFKPPCA